MNEDRIEGTATTLGGQAQEAVGNAIGNDNMAARGVLNQAKGKVQDGYGRVKDKVRDIVDDAPGTAREALDTGRDYYRRGSTAVAQTVGDNTALALLAAGVAGAALGWLFFGQRSKKNG